LPKLIALSERTFRFNVLPLAAGLLALGLGCGQDQVQHYRVPREAAAPSAAMGQMPGTPDMGSAQVPDSAKAQARPMHWTLPKGWTEEAGEGMRYATLKPPVTGRVEATVVVLPGPAGGELANVNRWRSQIALGPIEEAGLAQARTAVTSKAGAMNVYDFTSEGQSRTRVVAALLTTPDGNTWFLKLTGDAALVGQVRPDFMKLLGSLHLD